MEVGENTNLADANEALAVNSDIAAKAAIAAEVARVEEVKIQTTGESGDPSSLTKNSGNTEAGLYGDIGAAALTGGSASAELLQMGAKVISEGMDKSLGGMENPITSASSGPTKDILGNKVNLRSICTGPMDKANDALARSDVLGDFMSGKDKVRGVQSTQKDVIDSLQSIQLAQQACQAKAELHAGNAINHKTNLGAEAHRAQQNGYAPGGSHAQPQQIRAASLRNNGPESGPSYKEPIEEGTVT